MGEVQEKLLSEGNRDLIKSRSWRRGRGRGCGPRGEAEKSDLIEVGNGGEEEGGMEWGFVEIIIIALVPVRSSVPSCFQLVQW